MGSDDPSVDVPAVQAAVFSYDEVILKGTFDFGTSSVFIGTDVTILGDEAVIRHGWPAFWVYNLGGTVGVSGIYFEGPTFASLYASGPLARIVFRDNTISMTGSSVYYGVYIYSREALIESNTIDITNTGMYGMTAGIWFEQSGLTPGSSTVSGNHVTCFNSDGIKCNWVENVDIAGNMVYVDATLSTVWETILLRGSHSRMTHNEVGGPASPVSGTTLAGPTVAAGADNYVAYNKGFGFLTEGIRLDACDDSVFEHNTFDDISGVGIAAFRGSDGNIFKSNKFANIIGVQYWLAERGFPYTWGILIQGVGNVVSNNKFSGEADYGVLMMNDIVYPGVSSGNTFRGNNLATMDAGTATYWCMPGTSNNVVIGYSGTVIDEGVDNSFRGK